MSTPYLSKRIVDLKPSGIRKYFDIASTMKNVVSLSIGEPDFTTPVPILEAGIRSLQEGETHYTSNAGRPELRAVLSNHLSQMYGVSYDPGTEMFFSAGGSEALHLAMQALLDPGDEVILLGPYFVSYLGVVALAGGVPVEVACRFEDDFDIDVKAVEEAITERTKVILINFPCNPTGAVASRAAMEDLARVAEKHDLIVISDEIYDQLLYGVEHTCFSTLPNMRERTILIGGFSKDYAMCGWRIGYACGPEDLIQAMLRAHQYILMCISTTAQDAAIAALQEGRPFVEKMVEDYDRRRKLMVSGLNEIGLPTVEPKGAFYVFPKVDVTGLDDEAFAEQLLLEERVALVPGSAFGEAGRGYVRCSYATAYDQLEAALEGIERFVRKVKG